MVSDNFKAEAEKECRWIPITLLKITHKDLSAPIYYTQNGEDVVSNGVTYSALPFSFAPPKTTNDGIEPGQFVVENISGQAVEALRAIAGNSDPALCSFMFVMPNDWDTVERKWPTLLLRNVQYTDKLTGTLCHPGFDREPHTKVTASDANFPGL